MSYKPSPFLFYFVLAVLLVENIMLEVAEIRAEKAHELSSRHSVVVILHHNHCLSRTQTHVVE